MCDAKEQWRVKVSGAQNGRQAFPFIVEFHLLLNPSENKQLV